MLPDELEENQVGGERGAGESRGQARVLNLEKPDLFMVWKMGNGDFCCGNMLDPAMNAMTLTERIIS